MAVQELTTVKKLPRNELQGLLSLLGDSEEKTLSLIAQQIRGLDQDSLQALDELAQNSNNEALLDNWFYVSRLSLNFEVEEWTRKPELESGLFLLAKMEYPGLDVEKYSKILDNYAERVEARTDSSSSSYEVIQAINHVLYHEEALSGNQISYYDLNNNFVNSVLETKTGNPIVMSSIYILVARRLGLEIRGVGTPGHFVVKFEDQFLDPFFGGREVTKDECIIRAQELGVYWRNEYLDPIDDSAMVARCLRNLIAIYKKHNMLEKAGDASEILRLIG